jgi:dTDP-4-dehydrorhamnose 3,5-epimerase
MIEGVMVKDLYTHFDERGFFREIIRVTDEIFSEGFGQLSHSLVRNGVIKAWHAHKYQGQWNYVSDGLLSVVLYDDRQYSSTHGKFMEFIAGNNQMPQVYYFPAGVLHGYRCVKGPVNIFYVTSGAYDLADEIRVPYDDPKIGFDWHSVPLL